MRMLSAFQWFVLLVAVVKSPRATLLCAILLSASVSQAGADDSPRSTGAYEKKVILVLGDSLAAGSGVDPDQAFPAVLQQRIDREGWAFTVVNAGVSGDTTSGGLRRLDWLLRQRIDVLLIELGGNDGLRGIPPDATRANLQAIIDRAKKKYPDLRIVIAGMRMPPNLGSEYGEQFESVFTDVAGKNDTLLIPFLLEGVGGVPELNQSDRIHPTAEGHRILAENAWKVMRPLLEELVGTDPPRKAPVSE